MTDRDIARVIKRLRWLHGRMTELQDAIRDEMTMLAGQEEDALAELEELLRKRRTKTARMGGDQFTRVQSVKTTYDPDVLKKHLNRTQRALVIKEVVDVKALEAAVDSGLIASHQVREAMTRRPNKAYIKVTWRAKTGRVKPDTVIPEERYRG
jgi:hypothetical protein